MFMLANSARPSRYIQELCEVAGEEIRFETIDGRALQQCPTCRVGQLVERRTKTGRSFVGCSQYPDCRHVTFPGRRKQNRSLALRPLSATSPLNGRTAHPNKCSRGKWLTSVFGCWQT